MSSQKSEKKINYSTLALVKFEEADVQAVLDAMSAVHSTKTIASLTLDNITGGEIPSGVLAAFEKLASVLKLPVTKTYAGLEIVRPYTDAENREAAEQSLKYGYTDLTSEIRDRRAAEQGIEIYEPEQAKPES